LREIGIEADLTQNVGGADRGRLRRYDAASFRPAVGETTAAE
jgi:hypothetical protein